MSKTSLLLLNPGFFPVDCRPLSKRKSWTVTEVLHKARVFDASQAAQGSLGRQQGAPSFAAAGVQETSS